MKFNRLFNFAARSLKHFVSGKVFAGGDFGLSDLLLYAKMVDEGVILQTDGSFLAAFWFKGSDLETSTDEELAILSSQLTTAFNLLGSGWLFHIDTIRYMAQDYTHADECHFPHATTLLIDSERRDLYQKEGKHFENAYVISFTFCPTVTKIFVSTGKYKSTREPKRINPYLSPRDNRLPTFV